MEGRSGFSLGLTEVDYVKLTAIVYAYVLTATDYLEARDLLSRAIAACPDEAGFRRLVEIYDGTGGFPTYGFLAERGDVALSWDEVEALAGRPNKSDAEVAVEEARWARAAIDFRAALDGLRGRFDHSGLDDATHLMSEWVGRLSLAARPRVDEEGAAEVYERRMRMHGGIQFFVSRLDSACRGVEPGTLAVVAGFAGHGKTTTMLNMAYANAVRHNICSVFVTFEVRKDLLKLWFTSRHSLHPKFEGKPALDRMSIQKGLLTTEQHHHFLDVAADWEGGDHGRVRILDAADFSSFEIGAFVERIRAEMPYEAVFVDYVNKFKNFPVLGIRDQYERINYAVEGLEARLALGSTPSVPVVVGAQIARRYYEAYKEARREGKVGGYDESCFAEANALEKSSYYAIALFADDTLKDSGLMQVQLLKHRGGETIHEPFEVKFEPAYAFVGDDDFAVDGTSGVMSFEELLR